MGRTGFDVKHGDVADAVEAVRLPGLDPEGVFTHFAVSDEPARAGCDAYTQKQFQIFTDAIASIEREAGLKFRICHCTNSGAMVNYPAFCLDMSGGTGLLRQQLQENCRNKRVYGAGAAKAWL